MIAWLIDLIKSLFGWDPEFLQNFPADAKGWGWVNQWMQDPERLIDTLADNGCNATHIEYLGFGANNAYLDVLSRGDRYMWCYNALKKLLKQAKRRGVFVTINLVNANVGDTKYQENGPEPWNQYHDAWFSRLADDVVGLVHDAGMSSHVAIGAVSEWQSSKAERWCNILASKWAGAKLWNRNSRPSDAPDGWIIEYHPFTVSDYGPLGSYVITDTGQIISIFGDFRGHVKEHTLLLEYASTVMSKGNGFMFYCFNDGGLGIDEVAIKTIGKVA